MPHDSTISNPFHSSNDHEPAEPPESAGIGLDPEAARAGYVFDPTSGFHWHPYAEHWYQPSTRTFLDVDGAPLDPLIAEARAAEAMAHASPADLDEDVAEIAEVMELDPDEAVAIELEAGADEPPVPPSAFDLDAGHYAPPEPSGVIELDAVPLPPPEPFGVIELDAVPLPPPEPSGVIVLDAVDEAPPDLSAPAAAPPASHLAAATEWTPQVSEAAAPMYDATPVEEGTGIFGALRSPRRRTEPAVPVLGGEAAPARESASAYPGHGLLASRGLDPATIPSAIEETWRVVVHLQSGAVQRGAIHSADLQRASIQLSSAAGPELLDTAAIKAIFFMREAHEPVPVPAGRRVKLTLLDGRILEGFAPDPLPPWGGFFLLPADTRANTAWIFVYPHAIRDVALA